MTLAAAHDALVGRSLGEFVLRERIGEGGFGAVYRAIQPALDREAVVKVLHTRLHASKAASERFLREAKLASKLDHPYAAHIYAFGAEPDGELWIAMELVRGTPLDQVLKLQGPLTLERLVPLLDRICEVVHTAHESGIVHRDLKPANVMVLARAGRLLPKLLDFGIAKGLATTGGGDLGTDETVSSVVDGNSDPFAATLDTPPGGSSPLAGPMLGLTVRGSIMGSPPYMAPEQWLDAGQVDARTDLYALGILAFECLTGKPPFMGHTITAIAQAHANDPVPLLGNRFPGALDRVLAKAMAKAPADRYPDALAFAAALRAASGIATETQPLPAIETAQRDLAVTGAPQPIAEAIAAFEASRNSYQARDALALVGRTIARYLGLLALACRSRVSGDDHASETIRTLYRRSLTDKEWIQLARELTRPWIARQDAYPIPELVGAFHDGSVGEHLEAIVAMRDAEAPTDDAMLALLDISVAHATLLLEALGFLRDYPLVVTTGGGYAERWMGMRRAQRATIAVRGKGLDAGCAALLDRDGVPVLTLAPLFQIAAPTPGAPLDLFMFEGRDRRGAKLVALPAGFEHHDDTLWDWFRAQLTGSLDEDESTVAEEKPPYRGLSAFAADDSALFVGREKQVDAFTNRLKLQPLLVVVGRSGAGKSSFIHAGVAPALGWRTITLRPGPSPLGALIARLEHANIALAPEWSTGEGRVSGRMPVMASLREVLTADREALGHLLRVDAAKHGPILVVVDQLEELFTLCQDDGERKVFAESLAAAARSVEDPVRVVFTLRDDFLVRTEQVGALRNRIGQGLQILTVPAADDLLRIVTEPARRVGYELEGDLAAEMVKEVADQPGSLALISFTASKLWELRDRHFKQLTRSAYRTLGGVGGALARHAELTLDGMLPEERALTREAFRHLVTSQNTRAVLPRKELRQLLGSDAHADGVLEKLVAARLLVASENESGAETIEVIHEALLVTWPRLVEWRREDSEGTRFREQLRSAAKQWDERGRAKGLLWRGDALGELTRWRGRHSGPLTDTEAAFTDASLADVARSRRNVRLVLAGAFAVLGAVLVGLVILNANIADQRSRAESAARDLQENLKMQFEDQGRRLVLAHDPLLALAYLAKASDLKASGRAHDFLVSEAVEASAGQLAEVRHASPVRTPRFSSDGTKLITGGIDRAARIWDVRTGALLRTLPQADMVVRASFSPDDATALTASGDGAVIQWDASTGKELRRFHHTGPAWCAQYSPDGKLALTAGLDDAVVLWDLATGAERARGHGDGAGMWGCAFSPDGKQFAVSDNHGTTWQWDAVAGKVLHELRGQRDRIRSLAFSPDGAHLVTASYDGTAVEWDTATGALEQTLVHGGAVHHAEFSPDGTLIATASADRTAAVWNARTGAKVMPMVGHSAGVKRALFTPDGKAIVTASEDGTAWLWELATGGVVSRWRGHQDLVFDASIDRSGTRVATASDDGRAIIWKLAPQDRVRFFGHGRTYDGQFSPDGARLVTAEVGVVRIWDTRTGVVERTIDVGKSTLVNVRFSPNGRMIATSSEDGVARIYDAVSGAPLRDLQAANVAHQIVSLAWSPDSAMIATVSQDGWLRMWDPATGARTFETRGHGGDRIQSAAFEPRGGRLITTGEDQAVRVWDLRGTQVSSWNDPELPADAIYDPTGQLVVSPITRQSAKIVNLATRAQTELHASATVVSAVWSPDGVFVATAAMDGAVDLWDARTGNRLATFPHPGEVRYVAFSPDGRQLLAASEAGCAVHELALDPIAPAQLATVMKCRVPYVVGDDGVVQRTTAACSVQ